MRKLAFALALILAPSLGKAQSITSPGYCYFNNGMSMVACDANSNPPAGSVWFQMQASPAQLTAAFPGYAAASAAAASQATAMAGYAVAIGEGISITSTGTPTLNGNYAVDPDATANINSVATYLQTTGGVTFPSGDSTMPWADTAGNWHTFASGAQFIQFAQFAAQYVLQCKITAASIAGGQSVAWPSNTKTIQ
jgi:hypothetical protein